MFIFWPEFIKKQGAKEGNRNATFEEISEKTLSSIQPIEYYEGRLAWSEYVDDKWSSKQLTKEFIEILSGFPIKGIIFKPVISESELYIISFYGGSYDLGSFKLDDIQSKVMTPKDIFSYEFEYISSYRYYINYEKHTATSTLFFLSNTYLQKSNDHNLIFSVNLLEKEKAINSPFFYSSLNRTYFVHPYDYVKIWDVVKKPDSYIPVFVDHYLSIEQSIRFKDNIPGGGFTDPVPERLIDTINFRVTNNLSLKRTTLMETNAGMLMAKNIETTHANVSFSKANLRVSELSIVENSFADILDKYKDGINVGWQLEFHTFYHPYSSQFVTNLNQDGIKGLMDSDTLLNSSNQIDYNDSGQKFVNSYSPNFSQNLVKKAPVLNDYKAGEAYTYYKENVCFDVYGANSIYNWELFFHAPLYIATRLSKNGKYKEAMKWFHYIFDPTTDEVPLPGQSETSRYWKVLPFKTTPAKTLEEWFKSIEGIDSAPADGENDIIAEWRKNPFKPFVVARNRPLAFMKNVVIKYVENRREWGDSLFRQFTRESVNEALHLYVIANHILGPRPEFVP